MGYINEHDNGTPRGRMEQYDTDMTVTWERGYGYGAPGQLEQAEEQVERLRRCVACLLVMLEDRRVLTAEESKAIVRGYL